MKLLKNLCRINFLLLFVLNVLSANAQTWTKIGTDITGESKDDGCGESVSINSDGSIVAVGAPWNSPKYQWAGHVRIYKNNSGVWTQIGKDIDGNRQAENSGTAISLSGDGSIIAVGAPGKESYNGGQNVAPSKGYVRIYKNLNSIWTQVGQEITDTNTSMFGESVSLSSDGSIVAAKGSSWCSSCNSWSKVSFVKVFKNINGTWTQIGKNFGVDSNSKYNKTCLSGDGNTVAVYNGNRTDDDENYDTAIVRIFRNNNGTWTKIGADITGVLVESISINSDGNVIAVGTPRVDWPDTCYVRIYKNINGIWTQVGKDIKGDEEEYFGYSLSINSDGNVVAIGAPHNNNNGDESGAVRVYKNINGYWTELYDEIQGKGDLAYCGTSVAISSDGNILVTGSTHDGGNGIGVASVYGSANTSNIHPKSNDIFYMIYPNPTESSFYIETEFKYLGAGFSIFSTTGAELMKGNLDSEVIKLNLSDLTNGLYLLSIKNADIKQVFKIVKK
jgi:hypothetical protein